MIFDVVMTAAVLCLAAAVILRLIAVSSGKGEPAAARAEYLRKPGKVFLYALLFRIAVFIIGAAILYMLCGEKDFSAAKIISAYHKWDADHYINIAKNGYASKIENGRYVLLVFYPLYPLLTRIFAVFVRSYEAAGLLVSWLSYAAACSVIYSLLSIDYSERTAENTLIYLSVFPFAFFFGACMSESTFLLTAALTLYFIRRHKWLFAGLFGMLCALSRVTGVMLVFAYFAEWMQQGKIVSLIGGKKYKEIGVQIVKNGLYVLIIPAGFGIYLLINYLVAGDMFAFLEYEQAVWYQHMQFFAKTFATMREYAFAAGKTADALAMWIPQIGAIILCIVFSFLGLKRHRMMYYGFMLPYLLTNISTSWPISGCRYISCALPMFLFMGEFSNRHEKSRTWIIVIFSLLFGIYFAAYFKNMIC